MKPSDRYLKVVEWSSKDGCYVGTCPGLMFGGVHGSSERAVYAELCDAVEEWIRIHAKDKAPLPPPTAGKSYSGKFMLRLGRDLHKRLAVEALREGQSLNALCVKRLAPGTGGKSAHRRRIGRTG